MNINRSYTVRLTDSGLFLLGAEFTWVYAQRFGSRRDRPEPTPEVPAIAQTIPVRSQGAVPGRDVTVPAVATSRLQVGPGHASPWQRPSALLVPAVAGAALGAAAVVLISRLLPVRKGRVS